MGASQSTIPGGADAADVNVIDGWVTALRHGKVRKAASYFAIPSVAQNGGIVFRIQSRPDAIAFNHTLPCGARLVRARTQGRFTTATFRLTERPGPGVCGPGVGQRAATAFVIQGGKITQWQRVGTGGGRPVPGQSA
jgi:hypothetical protein